MNAASNVSAIVQKEWKHYFGSPIAWVVLFAWTFLFGVFFASSVYWYVQQTARMSEGMGKASVNDHLIRGLLQQMSVVAMFITPMITMRLFAEEKRQGSMELLATSPITDLQIVLGKYLAAFGLYALTIAASLVNFIALWVYSTPRPEWKPMAAGVLGLLLLGACYIAIGTLLSNLTRNQMVAGILTFCVVLALFVLGWWADDPMGGAFFKVLAYLAVNNHLNDFMKGVVNLKDVVFYLSFAGFGVFLANQSVASQRWRA